MITKIYIKPSKVKELLKLLEDIDNGKINIAWNEFNLLWKKIKSWN